MSSVIEYVMQGEGLGNESENRWSITIHSALTSCQKSTRSCASTADLIVPSQLDVQDAFSIHSVADAMAPTVSNCQGSGDTVMSKNMSNMQSATSDPHMTYEGNLASNANFGHSTSRLTVEAAARAPEKQHDDVIFKSPTQKSSVAKKLFEDHDVSEQMEKTFKEYETSTMELQVSNGKMDNSYNNGLKDQDGTRGASSSDIFNCQGRLRTDLTINKQDSLDDLFSGEVLEKARSVLQPDTLSLLEGSFSRNG